MELEKMRNAFGYSVGVIGSLAILMAGANAYQRYTAGPLVQDPTQHIHVYYDHQARTDVKLNHDGCDGARCFIATQSPTDAALSNPTVPRKGWYPSNSDLYLTHPYVNGVPAYGAVVAHRPRHHRHLY